MTRSTSPSRSRLRAALASSLADDELPDALAAALLNLDEEGWARLEEQLAEDTAATLRRAFEASRGRRRRPVREMAGRARLEQDWRRLWERWHTCVGESSDEHGRYVLQERHWEPPWLDGGSVLVDLDDVAAEMRRLAPGLLREGVDEDLDMIEVAVELGELIGEHLPEWIREPYDGVALGPELTSLTLEWEWGRRNRKGVFALASALLAAERRRSYGLFDEDALTSFFSGLAEEDGRELLEAMDAHAGSGPWAEALEDGFSMWFRLRQMLAMRFKPEDFERRCLEVLDARWEEGLPLLERWAAAGRAAEVLRIASRVAPRALGHNMVGASLEDADPRRHLYAAGRRSFCAGRGEDPLIRLVRVWCNAAGQASEEELRGALKVQLALLEGPGDGGGVLKAISAIDGRFEGTRARLLAAWKEYAVALTFGYWAEGEVPGSGYVRALVDAAWTEDASLAREAVCSWLDGLPDEPERMVDIGLATLTRDLDVSQTLAERLPSLHVLLDELHLEKHLFEGWRRAAFARIGAGELLDRAIATWRRVITGLVPDPSHARGSRYAYFVVWMAAARELDPEGAERLLGRWRMEHARRRKLWRELESVGIGKR